MKRTPHILIRVIAICLIIVLIFPVSVSAAEDAPVLPCASYYLDAYNTYICDLGNGQIQIWFEVAGTGYMDEIGVLSIELYEVNSNGSLTWVKTFLHENYSSMLITDDNYHNSLAHI